MSRRIVITTGDITKQPVDAIVNAANTSLLGGGGVDGAIHEAAGPGLLKECRALHGCRTGQAKVTRGYLLPAPWVIHTVGPVYYNGTQGEPELLAAAYHNSLVAAYHVSAKTIAFPAISTGAYGYPPQEAARIAVRTVREFLRVHPEILEVRFVCFSADSAAAHRVALQEILAAEGA